MTYALMMLPLLDTPSFAKYCPPILSRFHLNVLEPSNSFTLRGTLTPSQGNPLPAVIFQH